MSLHKENKTFAITPCNNFKIIKRPSRERRRTRDVFLIYNFSKFTSDYSYKKGSAINLKKEHDF